LSWPTWPALFTEEIGTSRPSQPPFTMASAASRMVRKVPVRLVSMTACHLARSSFLETWPVSLSRLSIVPSRMMPAQDTAMLSFPKASIVPLM